MFIFLSPLPLVIHTACILQFFCWLIQLHVFRRCPLLTHFKKIPLVLCSDVSGVCSGPVQGAWGSSFTSISWIFQVLCPEGRNKTWIIIHERIYQLRLWERHLENWLEQRIKNNWMSRIWKEFAFKFLCNSLWCDSKLQQHSAPVCTEIVGSLLLPELHQAWGDNAFLVFLLQVDTEG